MSERGYCHRSVGGNKTTEYLPPRADHSLAWPDPILYRGKGSGIWP